ncbi:MAG TPA: metalloregulator ArsR/SmtB family transcription factor [Gemmatimonadales bacterium]|jgi:ArsR family transcriptional regulator
MPAVTADLDIAAQRFHALSDPTRLQIVGMLMHGERCVCELMSELDAAQSRLSFHLRVLREAGLVTARREAQWMYYTLRAEGIAEIIDVLTMSPPAWKRAAAKCC